MRRSFASLVAAFSVFAVGVVAGCSGGTAGVDGPGTGGSSGSSGSSGSPGTPPATPPATTFGGAASGCGDVFAYRAAADGTQFVTVQVNRTELGIKNGEKRTIDLATAPSTVKVRVEVFARVPKEIKYCNDSISEVVPSSEWTAEAGTLELELGEQADPMNPTYKATVRLRNVRLVGPERGTSTILPSVEIKDVLVGWLAG